MITHLVHPTFQDGLKLANSTKSTTLPSKTNKGVRFEIKQCILRNKLKKVTQLKTLISHSNELSGTNIQSVVKVSLLFSVCYSFEFYDWYEVKSMFVFFYKSISRMTLE